MANSGDPDQMPQNVASDLGLHSSLMPACPNTSGKYGDIIRQAPEICRLFFLLSMQDIIISRQHFDFFSYFSHRKGFHISCKLFPMETIGMKCQILFSGKNKKNVINLSSAEFAQRVAKVNKVVCCI